MKTGEQIGDYLVIELIGTGGQAEVALAECTSHDNPHVQHGARVALKKFYYLAQSEKSNALFMERATKLIEFKHPNLIRYYDYFMHGEDRPEKCLVMEFVQGETMRDWLIRWNPDDGTHHHARLKGFSWEDASACIDNVIEGLIYARDRGFTHRDLKPDNIIIANDGGVKVLDFDIARLADDQRTHRSKSRNMTPIAYMAPEFLDASFMGDEQSDILSLGVTLYEALCGDTFCAQNADGLFGLALDQPALDDYVLPGIRDLIAKTVAPARNNRFQKFEDFRAAMSQIERRIISGKRRYKLIRFIKQGGFGIVYEAEAMDNGERVAIKRLAPPRLSKLAASEHRRKFKREAHILCKHPSPHIVRYLEHIEPADGSDPFLVMEYLDGMPGMSLSDQIRERKKLPPVEAANLFIRYADALHFLNENGIIHRDISPDNLYAPENPDNARLFDLGVARNTKATVTTGKLATKLQYAAPEFFRERGSPMTDIYALGLCLFEAITGQKAYPLTEDKAAFAAFRERMLNPRKYRLDTASHPEVKQHPSIKAIIDKACHPDAHKRYHSAAAMKADLIKAIHILLKPADGEDTMTVGIGATEAQTITANLTNFTNDQTVAGETNAALTNVPDTHQLTIALEQADGIERRLKYRKLTDALLKSAAMLILMGSIAAGAWYGPSAWQANRMQTFVRTFKPAADFESVQKLARQYEKCAEWEPRDRLSTIRWTEWKNWFLDQISGMPDVFAEQIKANPERLPALTEDWRKTEAIWKKEPFDKHFPAWQQLLTQMDFAIFIQALKDTEFASATEIKQQKDNLDDLIRRYPKANATILKAAARELKSTGIEFFNTQRQRAEQIAQGNTPQADQLNAIDQLSREIRKISGIADVERTQIEIEIAAIRRSVAERIPIGPTDAEIQAAIDNIKQETEIFFAIRDHEIAVDEFENVVKCLSKNASLALQNAAGTDAIHALQSAFRDRLMTFMSRPEPLETRSARLEAVRNLLQKPELMAQFDNLDTDKLAYVLSEQRAQFILRLQNSGSVTATVETRNLGSDNRIPPKTSRDLVITNINMSAAQKISLIPRDNTYNSTELTINIIPGGGGSDKIPAFTLKPVPVTINTATMTPPVRTEYRINEGKWLTLTSSPFTTNMVPPANIDLRFNREGFYLIEDTKRLESGEAKILINSPRVNAWRPIPTPEKLHLESVLASLQPDLEKAEAFIREDLAWAIQVMELDVNSGSVLAPRFRNNQPPPAIHWRNLQKPLQSAQEELQRLQTPANEQAADNQAEIEIARSKARYFRLWADQRGSNPASPEFTDQLRRYNDSSGHETRHARFSAAVLSNPSDRVTIATLGIGLDDLHRWRAHRDYREFNENGLSRLESLSTFAERNPVNAYDLRSGFLLTYLTWTVNSVLQDIERHERDPNRNLRSLRISEKNRETAKLAVSRLRFLLNSAAESDRKDAIGYLQKLASGNIDSEPRRAAIVLLTVIPGLTTQTYGNQIASMETKYQSLIVELKKLF